LEFFSQVIDANPNNPQTKIIIFICLMINVIVKLLTAKIVPSLYAVRFLPVPVDQLKFMGLDKNVQIAKFR
jgi:hypothetical protein